MCVRGRAWSGVGLVVVLLSVAGCGDAIRTRWFGGGTAIFTGAETRAVSETEVGSGSEHGRVKPRYVRCAEPSPDVAKAVANSFGGGLTAVVRGLPSGVTPEVAGAISRSHAEAIAQLTERLATMQLLRDGLYRACEAYANGAISDTTYAVMLSRFDKTMVTMLLGELAAGAFGRSLAGAGTGAESASSSSLDIAEKEAKSREAEATLKAAEERHLNAERDLTSAEKEASKNPGDVAATKKVEDSKRNREQTQKEVTKADRELKDALKAQASSAARALEIKTVGGIAASHSPEIARTLADLARKYIENLNFDAIEVACLSALDRPADTKPTGFATLCTSGILATLQDSKGDLLKALIDRATAERERAETRATLRGAVEQSRETLQAVDALLAEVARLKGTSTPRP